MPSFNPNHIEDSSITLKFTQREGISGMRVNLKKPNLRERREVTRLPFIENKCASISI